MMTKTLALRMAVIALTSSVAAMAAAQTLPERVGITVGTLATRSSCRWSRAPKMPSRPPRPTPM